MIKTETDFDVIIIGAGAGGLSAGVSIQSNNPGLKTLMLEKNDYPGGFIGGFFKKGFYFDAAAEAILNAEKGRAYSALTEFDFNHPFIRMDIVESYYDKNRVFHLYSDEAKLLQEIEKHFPDQLEKAREFINACKKITSEFRKVRIDSGKLSFKKILQIIFKYPAIRKYGRKNFKQLLDSFFTNEQLKNYFLIYSLWVGLRYDEISAPLGVYLFTNSITSGLFYPEGGMEAFAKKLAELFVARGGTLKYKVEVEKILLEDNKAVGVKLNDGTIYRAKYIISNADLKRTILNYVGKEYFQNDYIGMIEKIKQSATGLMLFLGIENMDLTKYPAHFHIGINPNIIEDTRQGKFELKEGLAVRIAANKDPDIRKDNKDSIHALFLAPYDWNNYWHAGKNLNRESKEYKKLKEELTEKMIKIIEQIIPEISKNIVYKSLSTPLTFERYNYVTDGSWYGPRYDQELPDFRLPIENLFLAGSNTAGAGVTGSIYSGILTGNHVIELINKEITKED
ncbi:MAG: NAD(P)/FAD-dependent oxidoreductase [Asgard group archaeon]|nr:NAD(P)/FAD-dependent oxidoreductase [Asgard group archaeon]